MAITARVVEDAPLVTACAMQGEATEGCGATLGETTQHLSPSPIHTLVGFIGGQKLRQHLL